MRVKFGNRIVLARSVSHNKGSNVFIVTTMFPNEVYSVSVSKPMDVVESMWKQILEIGYIDFSNCEYTN